MTPLTHQPTHGIDSGCIWPRGRSHAADLAQVRQCERDLQNLDNELAATVAA